MKAVLLILTFSFFQVIALAGAEPLQVTKEVYQNHILGKTLLGASRNGPWKVSHNAGSPRVFQSATGFMDEGKIWFNEDNKACSKWRQIYDGSVHCSAMFIDGNALMWTDFNGDAEKAKIMPGNYNGW